MLACDWRRLSGKRREHVASAALLVQNKLDGMRCVADTHTGRLFSRTGHRIVSVPHVERALRTAAEAARPPARWLDGELYCHGKDFQAIISAARRTVNVDDAPTGDLQLHLFDVVCADTACAERLAALCLWFDCARGLTAAGTMESLEVVHTEAVGEGDLAQGVQAQLERALAAGYEGVMLRDAAAPYECDRRSGGLIKVKATLQEEFAVVAVHERERQPGVAGAVECRTAAGKPFRATPEMSEAGKRELWDRRAAYTGGDWVASVRFQELTRGGVPRCPVLAGMRQLGD